MVLQTERYNSYPGGFQQQSYSSYQGPNGGYNNFHGVSEHSSPYSGSFPVSTYPSTYGSHQQSGWSSGADCYDNGANNYFGSAVGAHPVKPATNGYSNSYYESSQTYGSPHGHGHGSPHGHAPHGHGNPTHLGHGSPNHHGPHGHGSPTHHVHGSHNHHGPHGHGSSSHDLGKTQGFGGAISNQINKLTHGLSGSPNNHGHGSPDHQGHGNSYGFGKPQGFGGAITNQVNKLTHGHNNYGSGGPNHGHGSSGFNHGYNQPHHQPSWTVKGLSDDDD